MKVSQEHRTTFLLGTLSIVIALLLVTIEIGWPRAQTSAAGPVVSSNTWSATMVEEASATLAPANLKSWEHYYDWEHRGTSCGPHPEDIPGSIIAGFKQSSGCPGGSHTVYRGTVWFDLSDIISKAPPLHVSVQSAMLHFKQTEACPGELLVGTADWMGGYATNTLVPGDANALASLPSGVRSGPFSGLAATLGKPCGDCSIEVGPVVNNWLKGEEHGGYANYGFVFKGMREADSYYGDSYSCVARYGDFSLTVKYKYDKTPLSVSPGRPPLSIPVTNCALATNLAKASASSTYDGYSTGPAIDGDRKGLNGASKGGVWHSAGAAGNDWLEVDFNGQKYINEIDVFTLQDNYTAPVEPTLSMTFSKYGLIGFEVQYWNKFGSWVDVPDGNVIGNDRVWRQFTFPDLRTNKIRVLANKTADGYSRITELEAWCK